MPLPMNLLDESTLNLWSRCAVFLINLDRSPERLQLAHQSFVAAQVPYQRIAGFDASREDLSRCKIDARKFQKTHGRTEPRKGEIGVYQSHLKALRSFVECGKEFGVIMEDDVTLEPYFTHGITQLLEWSEHWDIVPLFHFHSGGPVGMRQSADFKLTLHLAHISSAAAYLVNRKAAAKLLAHMTIQRACVDHALFEKWSHGLRLRGISPMLVRLNSQANVSTIGVEKSRKLHFFQRFPTFICRSLNALKIIKHAVTELLRERFKLRG
jgi:glycosyl transferase family 25